MEFLRFGSSIPGSYWGCCAICIIQDFKQDPDEKASIEIVSGDGGQPIGDNFAGLTYREIFETRLRIGTFNTNDMPNHAFIASLTEWQISSGVGKKWLKILHENGFEFIRTVDNSVYSGRTVPKKRPSGDSVNKNHIFGLFRNIGKGACKDPLTPPKAWSNLSGGVKQAVDFITDNQKEQVYASQYKFNRKNWDKLGEPTFYTQAQVKENGVTVTFAGQRSKLPQQGETARNEALEKQKKLSTPQPAPFASTAKDGSVAVSEVV